MSKSTLLLWDIDGTIIVSQGAGVRAMERALTKCFGVSCDLSVIDWAGRTDSWIVTAVLRHVGLEYTPENARVYLETYLELLPMELRNGPQGQVLPGVTTLLELLHRHPDVAQGLLTGNLRRGAEHKLTHYGVWHYFAFGAFADDSPHRNDLGPHAQRRAKELHDREFAPERTFIIGDTPHDIACGKVIGAHTIAVATGQHSVAQLAAHQPTVVFPNLADTAAFLRTIGVPAAE
ncbi:MAG TPA: HAD family hydrolase [Opitutaceae bacterium]|nr:HAD family hydrolase [Opitutaceae bacterium]HRJ47211.1 HAD family hydrolase [Opitutaceae bacterium]